MAPQFLTLEEAAHMLGVTPDKLSDMRKKSEIFGYRDGSDWKFKADEVERVADEKGIDLNRDPYQAPAAEVPAADEGADELSLADDDDDSILVSEEELGHSGETTSSTIIGKKEGEGHGPDSDLQLADESPEDAASGVLDEDLSLGSDLDLADSLTLGESDVALDGGSSLSPGDSAVDLTDDDDDLVLGGGSDVSLAGDSGINLMAPSQSGISLEDDGLELGGSAVEALELPEDDDVISLEEDPADPEAATQLKADDTFDLSPVDFAGDEEDSGSQVIALEDSADYDENAATMLGGGGESPLSAPLEEDAFGPAPGPAGPAPAAVAGPGFVPQHALPEAPYGIFSILFLFIVLCILMLSGIVMLDLMSNMIAWNGPGDHVTPITEQLLKIFGMMK